MRSLIRRPHVTTPECLREFIHGEGELNIMFMVTALSWIKAAAVKRAHPPSTRGVVIICQEIILQSVDLWLSTSRCRGNRLQAPRPQLA